MSKHWKTKIHKRDLEVFTHLPPFDFGGGDWEMSFKGEEAKAAVESHEIVDTVIKMWDADMYDPEGSEAEKIHNIAVKLLEKGKPIKEVFDKINLI